MTDTPSRGGFPGRKERRMSEYKWVLMLEDGNIIEGEGNEKMLVMAMKTPGVVDGDICWNNTWKNLDFWSFLVK
jgi:hypothetical protein